MRSALLLAVGAVICYVVHRLNTIRLSEHSEFREAQ
jgi:hypothetical protein